MVKLMLICVGSSSFVRLDFKTILSFLVVHLESLEYGVMYCFGTI